MVGIGINNNALANFGPQGHAAQGYLAGRLANAGQAAIRAAGREGVNRVIDRLGEMYHEQGQALVEGHGAARDQVLGNIRGRLQQFTEGTPVRNNREPAAEPNATPQKRLRTRAQSRLRKTQYGYWIYHNRKRRGALRFRYI